VATLSGHTDAATSIAFTPDGRTLVSGGWDNTIRLWDVASRSCTATLTGHANSVRSVAVSPDGRLLASGSDDNDVLLWDLASQACVATLTDHTEHVMSVAFSPDGAAVGCGQPLLHGDVDRAQKHSLLCGILSQGMCVSDGG
jgi:WD40 repeat protein